MLNVLFALLKSVIKVIWGQREIAFVLFRGVSRGRFFVDDSSTVMVKLDGYYFM